MFFDKSWRSLSISLGENDIVVGTVPTVTSVCIAVSLLPLINKIFAKKQTKHLKHPALLMKF